MIILKIAKHSISKLHAKLLKMGLCRNILQIKNNEVQQHHIGGSGA